MTQHKALRLALAFAVIRCIPVVSAQGEPPEFINRAHIGDDFVGAFNPATADWIDVERSSDFLNWEYAGSVATTNAVTTFTDQGAMANAAAFYRLRTPGLSIDEAKQKWLTGPNSYQFNMIVVRSPEPQVLSARVTIVDGEKTISNATLNDQPTEDAGPDDFPSIVDIFQLLEEAQASGCWRVAVTYDDQHGFPSLASIEKMIYAEPLAHKQIHAYQISGFTVLE